MKPALRPDIRDGWIRMVALRAGLLPVEIANMCLADAIRIIRYRRYDVARSR